VEDEQVAKFAGHATIFPLNNVYPLSATGLETYKSQLTVLDAQATQAAKLFK